MFPKLKTAPMTDTRTAADIRLLPFIPAHLPGAVLLSQEARWPHRAEDWALTLAVSQGVVALDGASVVGTALLSGFGPAAAINMIIVAERHRGCGLGRRLMEAAMAPAQGQEMRLTATAEGLPLYEKLGFRALGRILQHQGIARAATPGQRVRTGAAEDLAAFTTADTDASGLERGDLLARIAAKGETLATDGGFAMLRDFGRGRVVGPVVARSPAAAQALIAEAACRCEGSFLRVDVPETTGLAPFAESLGLGPAAGGVAMVRNPRPAPARAFTTYALASQALG